MRQKNGYNFVIDMYVYGDVERAEEIGRRVAELARQEFPGEILWAIPECRDFYDLVGPVSIVGDKAYGLEVN